MSAIIFFTGQIIDMNAILTVDRSYLRSGDIAWEERVWCWWQCDSATRNLDFVLLLCSRLRIRDGVRGRGTFCSFSKGWRSASGYATAAVGSRLHSDLLAGHRECHLSMRKSDK